VNAATLNVIYDAKSLDLRDSLAGLVSQVRMALIRQIDEEFVRDPEVAPFEATAAQFAIIAFVLKRKVDTACELCKQMEYDRGAMSRMIDRLEAKGLIRRVSLSHTRRTLGLEVTAAGQAAFPKMAACLARVLNRMLRGVSKAQVREAEKVLQQMLSNSQ
jgi:DNA-binding MarR family transcriptional regulator